MTPVVAKAIEEIRVQFSVVDMLIEPDGDGGAKVKFGPVALGDRYAQADTWVAVHLPAQLPYADVYPIFVREDLSRADGQPLQNPVTAGHTFMGNPAVQVSRRSNGRDPTVDTPARKLIKVIDWLNSQ